MSKPVQYYLEWEEKLELDLLGLPISRFTGDLDAYHEAITDQDPLTVDQYRKNLGLPPHPDSSHGQSVSEAFPNGDISQGVTLNRGAMYVYQTDPGNQSSDATVPNIVLVNEWNQLVAQESAIERGGRTHEQLQAAYAPLYALAQTAAAALNVTLS